MTAFTAVFNSRGGGTDHAVVPPCRARLAGKPSRRTECTGTKDRRSANCHGASPCGTGDDCIGSHGTCCDPRHHTALANLVLLPAALAGLSDHDAAIARMLQYRACDLFNWHPPEQPAPLCPPGYPAPSGWAAAIPLSAAVTTRLNKRRIGWHG